MARYEYLFGPVPSRRLGVSLGVDLVRHKICSLDCVYCECGRTTQKVIERRNYVPIDQVKKELLHYFSHHPDPDYITFSGSGEPTLHLGIGQVIAFIKKEKPQVKVAVLTNSTLIDDPQVRNDLLPADLVMPSLDAVSQDVFLRINRPYKGLTAEAMVEGLTAFSRQYSGQIKLEVFILPSVNDSKEELKAIKAAIDKINPDLVQLNTLDRPGTVENLVPASQEELEQAVALFDRKNIEIIARVKDIDSERISSQRQMSETILETVHRRPCTVQDLAMVLGARKDQIEIVLKGLIRQGKIQVKVQDRGIFYQTLKE